MSDKPRRPISRLQVFYSGGAALTALLLYTRFLAPGLLPADPGEFQASVPLLGLAHPTGYPLYHLLGWVWVHLIPVADIPWRLNLFSAVAAALAVGGMAVLVTDVAARVYPWLTPDRHYLLGFVAALCLALLPTFWTQAIVAEVYALQALFTVALLYLALVKMAPRNRDSGGLDVSARGESPDSGPESRPGSGPGHSVSTRQDVAGAKSSPGPLFWMFLILGLALTHHVTTVLFIPALAIATWPHRSRLRHLRPWLALLLPLLLYAYIPLRAPHTPWLTVPLNPDQPLHLYAGGLAGFLDTLTGQRFQTSLLTVAEARSRLPAIWQVWQENVPLWATALALVGWVGLAWRRDWRTLAITLVAFLAQAGFMLFYGIGDVFVLFIPLYILAILWFALGLGLVAAIAQRYFLARLRALGEDPSKMRPILTPTLIIGLAVLWPYGAYSTHGGAIARSVTQRSTLAQRWWKIVRSPLPEGAVVVSNDRDEMTPALYVQWVAGERPDLIALYPLILPDPAWDHVVDVMDHALDSGRPVYTFKHMDPLRVRYDLTDVEPGLQRVASLSPPAQVLEVPLATASLWWATPWNLG